MNFIWKFFLRLKKEDARSFLFLCSLNVLFNGRVMLVKHTLYFWELVFIKTIILQKEFFVLIFKDYSWLLLLQLLKRMMQSNYREELPTSWLQPKIETLTSSHWIKHFHLANHKLRYMFSK